MRIYILEEVLAHLRKYLRTYAFAQVFAKLKHFSYVCKYASIRHLQFYMFYEIFEEGMTAHLVVWTLLRLRIHYFRYIYMALKPVAYIRKIDMINSRLRSGIVW